MSVVDDFQKYCAGTNRQGEPQCKPPLWNWVQLRPCKICCCTTSPSEQIHWNGIEFGSRDESAECLTLVVCLSWPSLLVAGLTHPDRAAAPASFWHGHPVTGARMAESFSTRAAVMLPLSFLKAFLAGVTQLKIQEDACFTSFSLQWHNSNPPVSFSAKWLRSGLATHHSPWSHCWVSSRAVPPGQSARRPQPWLDRRCTQTLTGSCSSSRPGPSALRSGGWSRRCRTKETHSC